MKRERMGMDEGGVDLDEAVVAVGVKGVQEVFEDNFVTLEAIYLSLLVHCTEVGPIVLEVLLAVCDRVHGCLAVDICADQTNRSLRFKPGLSWIFCADLDNGKLGVLGISISHAD